MLLLTCEKPAESIRGKRNGAINRARCENGRGEKRVKHLLVEENNLLFLRPVKDDQEGFAKNREQAFWKAPEWGKGGSLSGSAGA